MSKILNELGVEPLGYLGFTPSVLQVNDSIHSMGGAAITQLPGFIQTLFPKHLVKSPNIEFKANAIVNISSAIHNHWVTDYLHETRKLNKNRYLDIKKDSEHRILFVGSDNRFLDITK